MARRILTLLLIGLLALPATTATRLVAARPAAIAPVGDGAPVRQPAVAPQASTETTKTQKARKKHKPKVTTVRQSVTQTFTSAGGIAIPAGAPSLTEGIAAPYPATINVAGFTNGVITDVNLILTGFSHTQPAEVDVLLVPAHLPGQDAIVLSDVGSSIDAVNVTLTLDDQAAATLELTATLASGTFRPTNREGADGPIDPFPTQTPSGNTRLGVFTNANPNGAWQLFVRDDFAGDSGSIASWALQITADADVPVQEQVKGKKTKKKGKRR